MVCHASAWDVDTVDDLRIKMCIDITAEDFTTIHHELGHNFYQRAYNKQPFLFRDSANDGFHEAVGDTIALSVTPEYLVKIGLLKTRAGRVEGHRPAAEAGAGEGRVPAVRTADRPVALEGLLGRDSAGEVQPDVVGAAAEISGRRAAGAAHGRAISIRRPSITWPPTSRTRAISWPTSCSSSFIARSPRQPAARSRSACSIVMTTRKRANAWKAMMAMGASVRGRKR